MRADLPLDPKLLPGLPPQLHGQAHLDLRAACCSRAARSRSSRARIEAHDLEDRAGHVTPLGSYAVSFPGGDGEPVGQIRDLGGPLSVRGHAAAHRARAASTCRALVATRPEAAPELINNLRFLGSPDAAGRRQFTMTGTF